MKSICRITLLLAIHLVAHADFCWAQYTESSYRNLRHAKTLEAAGVKPVQDIKVGNALFRVSNPIRLDESHQIAVLWIAIESERAIRVLYRSNSQCSWRSCDATTSNHIGKGFHEFDKQVPIDVTLALLRSGSDVVQLNSWFDDGTTLTQEMLAHKLLRLLTVDRDLGIRSGDIDTFGGTYVTREYASTIPIMPVPFSIVRGRIANAGGGSVADPERSDLPDHTRRPNFGSEIETVDFTIPSYARFVGGTGRLIGRVYLSHDKTVKYFFVEDHEQRVMLSGAELLTAPVSLFGTRTRYLDTRGMDTPLLEYGAQIPERYGGRKKGRYQLAWQLVREQPIVALYYRELQRPVPPQEQSERMTKP